MQKLKEYSGNAIYSSETSAYGRASHDSANLKAPDRLAGGSNLSRRVGGWVAYLFSWYAY